jgi:hypothetical protein
VRCNWTRPSTPTCSTWSMRRAAAARRGRPGGLRVSRSGPASSGSSTR